MEFKVEISAKNMEVTERISDYVNKKVAKFDRLLTASMKFMLIFHT